MEDLRGHVIVGEDHRMAFALERVDGGDIGREDRPLDFRDDALHPGIEGRGGSGDCRVESGSLIILHDRPHYAQYEHIYGVKKRRYQTRRTALCYS